MSMTEKLLNKIRQKLLLMIMTRKIFHMTTMLIMKKMRMKHFYMMEKMTKLNRPENYMFCMSGLKQQQQTNPKIICSAVHLSKKIVQKDTNILLQKKIKERDASASFGK